MKKQMRNVYKKLVLALCLVMSVVTLSGCKDIIKQISTKTQTQGEFPVVIGQTQINAAPQKAVVLSASLADVIIALGNEDQLAAVTDQATQVELTELVKVGETDAEAINAVQPDLILTETLTDEQRTALDGVNAPIVEIAPATGREDYERMYGQMSSVFAGGGAGYDLGVEQAKKIFVILDSIQRLTSEQTFTKAAYVYDLKGNVVYGTDFASLTMEYAGLTNIFPSQGADQSSYKWGENKTEVPYNLQVIKTSNPEVIFCAPGLKEQMKSNADFSSLSAVKSGRVFEIDPILLQWQGRSIITVTTDMAEYAFPELSDEQSAEVTDPTKDIEKKAAETLSSQSQKTYETLDANATDKQDEVLAMQNRLSELHYLTVSFDGTYGDYTKEAVGAFQKANSLPVTGVADNETQQKLFSESAVPNSNESTSESTASADAEAE
ncbi:peptidoglycan-binding protein [Scatolibacter rhodanostii]|uniref:peptidoglycan-binding protein n=1 Tax=Scatolibacter rhodanostii TaxID=2014781 RepID=UPI000C071538|nr:peptidoglycan-binding protein [Scatolibacter rhodanostii]